jgi:protein-arginine deiminase
LDGRIGQAVAILPGIRAKHEGSVKCGSLDHAIRDYFQRQGAIVADVAEPRAGKDWIDWFGNLEVSPPVIARNGQSFPLGRVLTGRQGLRSMHPNIMAFLEAQRVQWPPLVVDTSWLEIGHVDEVVNFVPAAAAPGFRVLFPSVRLARGILEAAIQRDFGKLAVFADHQYETTVQELLEGVALSEENQRIQEILLEIKAQVREGLGIQDAHFVELPALFRNGEAVIPNLVNSLVVGQHLFASHPLGPVVAGEDVFAEVMTRSLGVLGLQVHFVDVWDYYHLNLGEIHCGTNAVRRVAYPRWWLHHKKGHST